MASIFIEASSKTILYHQYCSISYWTSYFLLPPWVGAIVNERSAKALAFADDISLTADDISLTAETQVCREFFQARLMFLD